MAKKKYTQHRCQDVLKMLSSQQQSLRGSTALELTHAARKTTTRPLPQQQWQHVARRRQTQRQESRPHPHFHSPAALRLQIHSSSSLSVSLWHQIQPESVHPKDFANRLC